MLLVRVRCLNWTMVDRHKPLEKSSPNTVGIGELLMNLWFHYVCELLKQYENRKRDEIVSRKIEENRASYKQLLIESLLTPPQNLCCAAVRVENTITYVS